MAKKAKSSSSSSSDSSEDLTAFQSVAVSFEEITSKQKEVAEQAKQRLSGTRKRNRTSNKSIGNCTQEHDSGGEDEDGPLDQLNPIQLKVAAALDSLLEGRLKVKLPGAKRLRREARAAEKAEAAEAAAAAPGSAGGAAGWQFRFFSRVPAGTAVVLEPEELPPLKGTPFPDTFRQRRAPPVEAAAAALPALAVEGAAILEAATAVATAAAAAAAAAARVERSGGSRKEERGTGNGGGGEGAGTSGRGTGEGEEQGGEGAGGEGSGGASEQGAAGLSKRQLQKLKKKQKRGLGEGVVLEARPFVPQEERMRRLTGE
ncbi:hypothetical protein Agub_g2984 [Astrephomene gubernaculifera]|uniref:Uncharacterized protein n=1 Tax=Astrephomene gubernaculifera TaxID=47775 RepID=A0AAD3HIQ4_9CHLO|nr:hypothetical protein Agub_g2984 [Astrephomene gubernaculifera]